MSPRNKWIGLLGNGAVALFSGIMMLYSLGRYGFFPFLLEAAVCALAVFNIRIFIWTEQFTSEEEWLKAELRKAELRRQIASYGEFAHEPDAVPVAPPDPDAPATGGRDHLPLATPDSGDRG